MLVCEHVRSSTPKTTHRFFVSFFFCLYDNLFDLGDRGQHHRHRRRLPVGVLPDGWRQDQRRVRSVHHQRWNEEQLCRECVLHEKQCCFFP